MNIKDQEILHPGKLRAARFFAKLTGNFYPKKSANLAILKSNIKKILIQEHQCIGDVLMLEPTLASLKVAFPEASVHLLCVPAIKKLAQRAGLADKILEYPNETPLSETYDIVFDFHGDIRRLRTLKKFKSKYYAGFNFSGGGKWLTHVADYPFDEHQVKRPFYLLKEMDIKASREVPKLEGFDNSGKVFDRILLHPGANHEGRRWPKDHWLELARLLKEDKHEILWITPPGEEAPKELNAFSGSLLELAEITSNSALLVGCDSMSVHLAVALGTHALSIFGSQDPELTKPYGPKGYFIIPEKECTHRRKDWRLCRECMRAVKPLDVYQKINSILPR